MTSKLFITVAALLVFAAAFILKESQRSGSGPDAALESAQSSQAQLPRLIDLGSDKCIPCKEMAPILKELGSEYSNSFVVEFIDVWQDPDAGKPFDIRVIPTQIFFDASGEERFRHEGFFSKDAILQTWKDLGIELSDPSMSAES